MKVDRSKLAAVFTAIGVAGAGKWSAEKLQKRLPKLEELKEPDTAIEDEDLAGLYDDLVAAQKKGKAIDIVEDAGGEDEEKPKAKKKGSSVGKGPGVISTIAEVISGASETKPVSKDDILKVLKKKFPDRGDDAMMSTINIQVPSRLRAEKGMNIEKNSKGYYVADGKVKVKATKKKKAAAA